MIAAVIVMSPTDYCQLIFLIKEVIFLRTKSHKPSFSTGPKGYISHNSITYIQLVIQPLSSGTRLARYVILEMLHNTINHACPFSPAAGASVSAGLLNFPMKLSSSVPCLLVRFALHAGRSDGKSALPFESYVCSRKTTMLPLNAGFY